MKKQIADIFFIAFLLLPTIGVAQTDSLHHSPCFSFESVSVSHYIENLQKPIERYWNLSSVETKMQFKGKKKPFKAVLIPRFNIGSRSDIDANSMPLFGYQYQLDAYLVPNRKNVLNLGYGFSASDYFATHQVFGEYTYTLNKAWGVSAAVKYSQWTSNSVSVTSLGLGVEKYIGSLWLSFKPNILLSEKEIYPALSLGVRNYFKDERNFLHLGLNYGVAPEYINYQPDLLSVLSFASYGAYLSWQIFFAKHWFVKLTAAYRYEEYKNNAYRSVVGGNIGISYQF